MAVYKRTYRGYTGPLTPAWSRFLVLYRASRRTVFRSKFSTTLFVLSFFFPLLCLLGVYANAHLDAFSFLGRHSGAFLSIDGDFFLRFLGRPERSRVPADGLYRTGTGLSGSRKWRAHALSMQAPLTY